MTAHAEVRDILERYRLRTKKRLGQNFLVDGHVLNEIAQAAADEAPPAFIEIGPGPGTLTRRLAQFGRPVVAIEKDAALVDMLKQELAAYPNVSIVCDDALHGRFAERIPSIERPAVVGNIPYNISSPLIVKLVEERVQLGPVTLLMQREVVDRLRAEAGSRVYGRLSVLLQVHAELERVRTVAPGAFWPPPKVHSAVIRWRWRRKPAVEIDDPKHFESVVKAAFGQRRKMLRNALRSAYPTDLIQACEDAGFDVQRRAEQLTLSDFAQLAALLRRPPGEGHPTEPD